MYMYLYVEIINFLKWSTMPWVIAFDEHGRAFKTYLAK